MTLSSPLWEKEEELWLNPRLLNRRRFQKELSQHKENKFNTNKKEKISNQQQVKKCLVLVEGYY